ncbi:MAG: nucleotidyltransferase domain-containing protein [Elusimicrobiales bacterium]|nr:nucleotidyltransferase domain-containing protein [Elusimicrobiales bacterium]HOJ86454.1 nucleotidyltransferase domain-containing protein [Elusimicrobiales bacterium]HOL63581.1 nucleotidyltransferase domain-containing protein [Elusimicrobiales bacterium]HPO95414.1 nucleotidyltransferase domain-containing protein [Elusimicrobiales bacterium]
MEEKISELKKFLIKTLNPNKIIIFGSRAKNENKKFSDIDICVVGSNKPDHTSVRKIKEEIDEILGIYSYDLIFWEDIDEEFKKIINSTGKVIYDKIGSNNRN